MHNIIKDRKIQKKIVRYLIMAVFIVIIEVGSFAFINNILAITYLIATPISMLIGIILNWYFSKIFVFKTSNYASHQEFILVFLASLVGLGIQMAVVVTAVGFLGLLPLVGKILAIGITFIWNFWIRQKFIFKEKIIR